MKKLIPSLISILAVLIILSSCKTVEENSSTHFLVVGHAYGSPGASNLGIDQTAYSCIQKSTNEKRYDFIVFTGDFMRASDTVNIKLVKNQLDQLQIPYHIAPGNHDMGNRHLYKSYFGKTDYFATINDDIYIFLDNTKNGWNLDTSQTKTIQNAVAKKTENSNIFVFIHNVWWYPLSSQIKVNSHAGEYQVNLNEILENNFLNIDNEVYIIAGDVGTNVDASNSTHLKMKNIHLITSGIGNGQNEHLLEFDIDSIVKIHKIDLNNFEKTRFEKSSEVTF
jgi:calcineurin-like phosphoesterase family protein